VGPFLVSNLSGFVGGVEGGWGVGWPWVRDSLARESRTHVPLTQPEDGQYRPKHVAVHYIVVNYTTCGRVLFDYVPFSKSNLDTWPRYRVKYYSGPK
jgi:hypothetical protein